MHSSKTYEENLQHSFHLNPVGFKVLLPDGSYGRVTKVYDTGAGRSYKVIGLDSRNRFTSRRGKQCWFGEDELRLVYYTLSVRGLDHHQGVNR